MNGRGHFSTHPSQIVKHFWLYNSLQLQFIFF
jgi:hypothetical protein